MDSPSTRDQIEGVHADRLERRRDDEQRAVVIEAGYELLNRFGIGSRRKNDTGASQLLSFSPTLPVPASI